MGEERKGEGKRVVLSNVEFLHLGAGHCPGIKSWTKDSVVLLQPGSVISL